ncbi:MAG: hypothetical protein PVI54_13150 [Desulfobacteraceae bacterium]|jgi:hypothetical protein
MENMTQKGKSRVQDEKTGAVRVTPLNAPARRALEKYLAQQGRRPCLAGGIQISPLQEST